MSVFACGERTKLSGRYGPAGGSERTAACEPHPARTATRATAAAKRTSGGYLAWPVLHGIGRRRHDDRRRDLVVPGLLLLVPEHPEVAEEAHDPGQDAPDPADERAAVADRPAGREVDHSDVQQLLADRLAGGTAFEVGEVDEAPERADRVGERPRDHEQDAVDDREEDAERVRRDRVAKVEAHRLLHARREAAERARQAGERAKGAVEARVARERGERQARREHHAAGDPQLAGVEEHRSTPSHGSDPTARVGRREAQARGSLATASFSRNASLPRLSGAPTTFERRAPARSDARR